MMRSIFLRKSTKAAAVEEVADRTNNNDGELDLQHSPPSRRSTGASSSRPRLSNGRNQFMGDFKMSQSMRAGLTSFDGGFNPLKDDPAIDDLIIEMESQPSPPTEPTAEPSSNDNEDNDGIDDNVMTPVAFDQWRQSFLEAIDVFLEEDGTIAAQQVYDDFHAQLKTLTKIKQQLQAHIEQNRLLPSPTVKARKCLSELQNQCSNVTKQLANFLPGSGEDKAVKTYGYTNYHMGAVLVRNGFQLYGHLRASADLLLHYRTLLEQVADKQLHQVIDNYHTQLAIYCDVLASLGLFKVMINVRYILDQHAKQRQRNHGRASTRRKQIATSLRASKNIQSLLAEHEEIDFSNSEVDLEEVDSLVEDEEEKSLGDEDYYQHEDNNSSSSRSNEQQPVLLGKDPQQRQPSATAAKSTADNEKQLPVVVGKLIPPQTATPSEQPTTTEQTAHNNSKDGKLLKPQAASEKTADKELPVVVGKLKPKNDEAPEQPTKKKDLPPPQVGKLQLQQDQPPEKETDKKELPSVGKLKPKDVVPEPTKKELPQVGRLQMQDRPEKKTDNKELLPSVGKLKPKEEVPESTKKELPEVGKLQLQQDQPPEKTDKKELPSVGKLKPKEDLQEPTKKELPQVGRLQMQDQPEQTDKELPSVGKLKPKDIPEPTKKELLEVGRLQLPTNSTSSKDQQTKYIQFDTAMTTTISPPPHPAPQPQQNGNNDAPPPKESSLPPNKKGDLVLNVVDGIPKKKKENDHSDDEEPDNTGGEPQQAPPQAEKEVPVVGKLKLQTASPSAPEKPDKESPTVVVGKLKQDDHAPEQTKKKGLPQVGKLEPEDASEPTKKKDSPQVGRLQLQDQPQKADKELPSVGKLKSKDVQQPTKKELPEVGRLQLPTKSASPNDQQTKYIKFDAPDSNQNNDGTPPPKVSSLSSKVGPKVVEPKQEKSLPGRSKSCDDNLTSIASKRRGGKRQQDGSESSKGTDPLVTGKQVNKLKAQATPASPKKPQNRDVTKLKQKPNNNNTAPLSPKRQSANKVGKLAAPPPPKSPKLSPKNAGGRRATTMSLTIEDPKPRTTSPKRSPTRSPKKSLSPKPRRATIAVESPTNSPLQGNNKTLVSLSLPSIEDPKPKTTTPKRPPPRSPKRSLSPKPRRATIAAESPTNSPLQGSKTLVSLSLPSIDGAKDDEESQRAGRSKPAASVKASSEQSPPAAKSHERSSQSPTRALTDRRRSMRPLPPNLGIEDPTPRGAATQNDKAANNCQEGSLALDDDMSLGDSSIGSTNSSRPSLGRCDGSRFGESDDAIEAFNLSGCTEMTDAASERSTSTRSRRSMPRFFKKSKDSNKAEEAEEAASDTSQPDDESDKCDGKSKPNLFKRMFSGRTNRDSGAPAETDGDDVASKLETDKQDPVEDLPEQAAASSTTKDEKQSGRPKKAPNEDMDVPCNNKPNNLKNVSREDMDVPTPRKTPKKASAATEKMDAHKEQPQKQSKDSSSKPEMKVPARAANQPSASTGSSSSAASNPTPPAASEGGGGGGGGLRKHVLTITLLETADGTMTPRMVVVGHDDVDEGDDEINNMGKGLQDNVVVRHLLNALKNPDDYDLSTFLNVGR